jgi:hypothetical protein
MRTPRLRTFTQYLSTEDSILGFSSIAPTYWRTAENLRVAAEIETANQTWRVHWTVHSVICLYHAALECAINEEIALFMALSGGVPTLDGRIAQEATGKAKLDAAFSFFGVQGKQTPEIWDRTVRFIALRNHLYHHTPTLRDVREYPDEIIAALKDAGIEPVNTSWASQCTDIRLAQWSSTAVKSFIEDWCRARGIPSLMQLPGWVISETPAHSEGTTFLR